MMEQKDQKLQKLFQLLQKHDKANLQEVSKDAIEPVDRSDALPLSFSQQRLWFLEQLDSKAASAYHIQGGIKLRGPLNRQAMKRALDGIVARHEILRTSFAVMDGKPVQQILLSSCGLPLEEIDLKDSEDKEVQLSALIEVQRTLPFNLSLGRLIRSYLVCLGEQEYVLFLCMHHVISDGWSIDIFMKELSSLYNAFAQQQVNPLPDLDIQYVDYAAWQHEQLRTGKFDHQASYWKTQLASVPALLALPTDYPRPLQKSYQGDMYEVALDAQLTSAIRALSRRHGMTSYMILLAAWALLLSRLSSQNEVVIGTPVANRNRRETESLIGFFANTLALPVDVSGTPTVRSFLERVKRQNISAQSHQDIPFDKVVELVQPQRNLSYTPIFQAMFTWQSFDDNSVDLQGLQVSPLDMAHSDKAAAKFDLSLSLGELGERIEGNICYATSLFSRETIGRHIGYWRRILQSFIADDGQLITSIDILDEAERKQLVYQFNDGQTYFPAQDCIHQLIEQQVGQRPDAIAVSCGQQTLTYGELNAQANQLAHWLVRQGVCPDDRVAVSLERSCDLVVSLLAVLKAGGAYVPLDPSYPKDRLEYMLNDSQPVVLITTSELLGQFGQRPAACRVADIGTERPWLSYPKENLDPRILGLTHRHLAYVIYTSGSTGRPKGVMNEHRGVVNRIYHMRKDFGFRSNDVFLQKAPFSFDASVWELFASLYAGARLVMAAPEGHKDPVYLRDLIEQQQITILHFVPPMLQIFLDVLSPGDCSSLRLMFCGGQALPAQTIRKVYRCLPHISLNNMYGPTEAAVNVTCWPCPRDLVGDHVSIGRPMANTQMYVLDSQGQLVPQGVSGELYIGGVQVARGYLNQPELSAERFLVDPFSTDPEARLYRTGDLGRWRADGTLEYLGRNDDQVKIRGFRIELGEISSVLRVCHGIRDVIVVAYGDHDKRLAAYYTQENGVPVELAELKFELNLRLPEYMVPAAYIPLEELPLMENGKVDKKALPEINEQAFIRQTYEAPQGQIEIALAEIWQSLLNLQKVGRHDNFFELGGHSLLAVQMISRVRALLNVELSLTSLFAYPVLEGVAKLLDDSVHIEHLPSISALAPGETPPLSLAQQRLWFMSEMAQSSLQAYVISGGVRLDGQLDVSVLQQALDRIVERHATLRTHIENRNGMPVQVIGDSDVGFPLSYSTSADDPFMPQFNLSSGRLVQARLDKVGDQAHILRIAMHHIISDGWSLGCLVEELSVLYRSYLQCQPDPLAPLIIQYGDFAAWQHDCTQGAVLQTQQSYWVEQMRGMADCLALPTDRPRPKIQEFAGKNIAISLSDELTGRLRALSQHHGCTLFMTLLASWGTLMSRLSNQQDVIIGSPIAGRNHVDVEPLIGMFVNTLAMRVALSADLSTVSLLEQVKATVLAAQAHQDIPFEKVVEVVAPERSLSHSPIFQVMFALQNLPQSHFELSGLTLSAVTTEVTTAQFDLSLLMREVDGYLVGNLNYSTALFDETTVRRYLGYWKRLLQGMVTDSHQPVTAIPLLDGEERHRLVSEFNQTNRWVDQAACVHSLIEQQAVNQPDAVAVVSGGHSLTYGELNAQANQLAHYLRAQGVAPDSLVALCLDRGVALIVAMLAVLKAGGAYIPMDPAYPSERLQYIVQDSEPKVLIKDNSVALETFGEVIGNLTVIDSQHDGAHWSSLSTDNPQQRALTSQHLAYVVYTSGSTGKPKGVMVEHRNLMNLVHWHNRTFDVTTGTCSSAVAGLGFDASVWEIWPPLCAGAYLTLPSLAISKDPEALLAWWVAQPIEVGFLSTPLAELAFAKALNHPTLRTLLVGGDRLHRRPPKNATYQLINNYGPTETTVVATSGEISADSEVLHIGGPIDNTQIYILGEDQTLLPEGVKGEVYIGGLGVARGYLNRPELNESSFILDPFSSQPTARLYRTGDLARWGADGRLEYLGRNDDQVKIRGFRIELGEIEAALQASEWVEEAIVLALNTSAEHEDKRLVAYYTAKADEHVSIEDIRSHLAAHLPSYMVPAAYVQLDKLPLTANGKVDRKALPEPDESAFSRREYQAPEGELEQVLANIWQDLLKVEKVGRHDNFFELGGHSLLAVQLISHIKKECSVEATIYDLFEYSTLTELATRLAYLKLSAFNIDDLARLADQVFKGN